MGTLPETAQMKRSVQQRGPYEEREQLTRLMAGCEAAFKMIYDHYTPELYFKLVKLTRSETHSQELLQEVFLTVWKNRCTIDTTKSFRSYLYCIVINKTFDFFRKVARNKKMLSHLTASPQVSDDTEPQVIRKEKAGLVHKAIEELPPKRKEVFKLCKLEGKSYEEISQRMGISTSTITDHIVKANVFIRNKLASHFPDTDTMF